MYQVLETYKRFDQKNNMIFRIHWDPSQRYLEPLREETQLRLIERDSNGFSLKDFSLANASSVVATSLNTGINRPNSGLTSWQPLPVHTSFTFPEEKPAVTDAALITNQIKRVARFFGADLVGIANLDERWVYSHHYFPETGDSPPIEIGPRYKYVICMAVEMDYRMIQAAPSAMQHAETLLRYSRMAFLVSATAAFIRQLGYHAIPALNDTALNIPIAIDAGLGQLGRHGLLITPQFGPRQRLCKVITDLLLRPDQAVEFGVTEFCSKCQKCVRECPAKAISSGEATAEANSISNNPGVVKWPLTAEKCRRYWSKVGTDCGICIRVCPFNKRKGLIHDNVRWLVKRAPWVDPLTIRMDDLLGYGKYLSPDFFWDKSY